MRAPTTPKDTAQFIREYSNLQNADLLKVVIIDFETTSEVDLRSSSYKTYATGVLATVLMLLYQELGDEKPKVYYPGDKLLPGFLLYPERYLVIAFNIQFDRAIWNHTLMKTDNRITFLPLKHSIDAMALANMGGYRGSLNAISQALDLGSKLDSGKQIITNMKTRCTRNIKLMGKGEQELVPLIQPNELSQLTEYGLKDVVLTLKLCDALAAQYYNQKKGKITEFSLYKERKLWIHTAQRCEEGITADVDLLKDILDFGVQMRQRASSDMAEILQKYEQEIYKDEDKPTSYTVTKRRPILRFLAFKGIDVESIDSDTRKEILQHEKCDYDVREIIELIDLANHPAMLRAKKIHTEALRSNGQLRDCLVYYGAHTGRWVGKRLQLHNLPRVKENPAKIYQQLQHLKKTNYKEKLLPITADQVGRLLRLTLKPSNPNNQFLIIDFANIEARILADISGETELIENFRNNVDVYTHVAAALVDKPVASIAKDSNERRLGKACVLGLGYGMGHVLFKQVLKQAGLGHYTEEEVKAFVKTWRRSNKNIQALWRIKEHEITTVLKKHNCFTPETARRITYRLPGGRLFHLIKCYLDIEGEEDTIYSSTWHIQKREYVYKKIWGGVIVENIVQATARDILAHAILMCNPIFHVHDELIIEVHKGLLPTTKDKIIQRVVNQFETHPTLPLKVEHFLTDRFTTSGFEVKEEELQGEAWMQTY